MSNKVELKSTIQLPKTRFKMKANLPQREPETLKWWDRLNVYRFYLIGHRDVSFLLYRRISASSHGTGLCSRLQKRSSQM